MNEEDRQFTKSRFGVPWGEPSKEIPNWLEESSDSPVSGPMESAMPETPRLKSALSGGKCTSARAMPTTNEGVGPTWLKLMMLTSITLPTSSASDPKRRRQSPRPTMISGLPRCGPLEEANEGSVIGRNVSPISGTPSTRKNSGVI